MMRGEKKLSRAFRLAIMAAWVLMTPWLANAAADAGDVAAARGLVARVLPRHTGQVECELIAPEGGKDVYEIESRDGKIVLRGNNGVSLASALNEYLKYTAHCQVSACGSQMNLPATLPPVTGKIHRVATVPRRLIYNYCTFGYAMAWWDWPQWERELDWLALNGFNLPLIVTGQEAVWINTFTQYGYSEAEIRRWLGSPAHFPWLFMQNMESFGGELPQAWVTQRTELARKIIGRAHELGMDVVLQGYYGMVPSGFAERHPQARVLAQGIWCRTFKRPDMLDPADPMYPKIAATFMKEQEKLYGRAGFYAADPFHEGGVSKEVKLDDCGRRVFAAMQAADPGAIWVKQCWQTDNAKMLSTIPADRVLALDLWAEARPFWPGSAFKGKSWVWCVLHNFGGNVGLNADLQRMATAFPKALASPNKGRLAGFAMVPEGHGNTPVVYDLVPEFIWKSEPADLNTWIPQYLVRRYGADSAQARAAWEGLLDTVYAVPYTVNEAPSNAFFQARPLRGEKARTWSTTKILYDAAALERAWESLLDAAPQCAASDGYQYDLADVTRQVLADLSRPLYDRTQAAVAQKDLAAFDKERRAFLELMTDIDSLLATRREFLLGPWLADARRWGTTPETQNLHEWQARLLLTLWNDQPGTDLNDYANRQWSGLVRDYYRMRWEMYFKAQALALKSGKPLDEEKFLAELGAAEKAWTHATNAYPTEPVGDTVAVARRLKEKYRAVLREVYGSR
ncbi:alpha-N-acetylglucosaminidase [bacterium]|nr:alpha-N-acetylglucosaminidase [bacterium]